ncbi:hypothetical protein [Kalamiella sp. sgz302252]|uniref:hypothetical protein n=1 Tax=Pantoea sp. sgz302252 TaxID=3341827 RepID=UPI0036D3F3EA
MFARVRNSLRLSTVARPVNVESENFPDKRIANYLKTVRNTSEVLVVNKRLNYKDVMTCEEALESDRKGKNRGCLSGITARLRKLIRCGSAKNATHNSQQPALKIQLLGWHGTTKSGAKDLVEKGARDDYEYSHEQLKNNVYGEGIYIAGTKRHAGDYAYCVKRHGELQQGEVLEVWAVMETKDKPDVFQLEASKNKDFLIARSGMYADLFFKRLPENEAK